MKLTLASNSPRRRQLLALIGVDFRVVPASVDETPLTGESPQDYVVRLAAQKAVWVEGHLGGKGFVVAADTTVVDGNQILGKPINAADAEMMLRQLRGRTHQVYTGIAISKEGNRITECCETEVPMRQYTDEEIDAYISSGDPLDKAGAYAIQHAGFHPVEGLEGCYANVMGLPLCHLTRALRQLDVDPEVDVPTACQDSIGFVCPVYNLILSNKI